MFRELSSEEMLRRVSCLTPREVEYLRFLLIGSSDREIAAGMGVATRTVKQYTLRLRNILFEGFEIPHGQCTVRISVAVRISQIMRKFPLIAETLHPKTRPADSYTTAGTI